MTATVALYLIACFQSLACAQMNRVINVPPAELSAGELIHPGTQVNLHADGILPSSIVLPSSSQLNVLGGELDCCFTAQENSEVNIHRGVVGSFFTAEGGSTVTISGGVIGKIDGPHAGRTLQLNSGSSIRIEGGAIGEIRTQSGAELTLVGDGFELDGVSVADGLSPGERLPISFDPGQLFSGVLADGAPVIFFFRSGDDFARGTVTVEHAELPPIGSQVLRASDAAVAYGIRNGQTLYVDEGVELQDRFHLAKNSRLVVQPGGVVGDGLEGIEADVDVVGGQIGKFFTAYRGSNVALSGGSIGSGFTAEKGSNLSISGGQLGSGEFSSFREQIAFYDGSSLDMSGGVIADPTRFYGDATISGGAIGDWVEAYHPITFVGGEFYLNGEPFVGDRLFLDKDSTFAGILEDGTPFVISRHELRGRELHSISQINLQKVPLPATGALNVSVVDKSEITSVRNGQHVSVEDGGELGNHLRAGIGSQLTLLPGGSIGEGLHATGSIVGVDGGTLVGPAYFFSDSSITIREGMVGADTPAGISRSDDTLYAFDGASVHVSGGGVSSIWAGTGSEVTINGGVVGSVTSRSGSRVELHGGEYSLNGIPLAESQQSLNLSRDDFLTGVLEDGAPILLQGWSIEDDTLNLVVTEWPQIDPEVVSTSQDGVPAGLRSGQTLIIDSPVDERILAMGGSQIEIRPDGRVETLVASGADIRIAGGRLEGQFSAYNGTKVNIVDGDAGDRDHGLFAPGGLFAHRGSEIQVSGGNIAESVYSKDGIPLNGAAGSSLLFIGTDFEVDGVAVEVQPGDTAEISARGRDVRLTGRLANGDMFGLNLVSECVIGCFGIDADATLSIALLNPTVADVNEDGEVAAEDIDMLSFAIQTGDRSSVFDLNLDQHVDDFDRTVWIHGLLATEPGDADLNGTVNFADFLALSLGFGTDGGWASGDFSGDGAVTFHDFLLLSANFGSDPTVKLAFEADFAQKLTPDFGSVTDLRSVATPEPAGLSMLYLLVVGFVVIGRSTDAFLPARGNRQGASPSNKHVAVGGPSSGPCLSSRRLVARNNVLFWLVILFAFAPSVRLHAQSWRDSLELIYDDDQGNSLPYRLFLPPGHDEPDAEFPLVVYLHRSAHIGTDNQIHVSDHISGLIRATQGPEFTSILLAPQAPTAWWYDSVLPLTTELLDSVEQTLNVDSSRIYLTGTSMGGFGITDLISRFPARFAAAVPLSAGILAPDELTVELESAPFADAKALTQTPYWIFHGAEDTTTSVESSRELVSTIEGAGGSPRYTELPGGHDHSGIWSGIYLDRNNELYPWMFGQSLSVPEPVVNPLWTCILVSFLLGGRKTRRPFMRPL